MANANSFGLTDNLPTWTGLSTDNLGDYDNEYHQQIYLWGRLLGDIGALVQSADEVGGGLTTAAAGSGTGVVAAGGLIVAGHGAGVGGAAIYDANWTLGKLKELGVQVNASSSASSSTESAANNQTNTAHGNSNASASNSAKPQKGQYKPTGGHHVHSKAGFKDNVNYDPDKGFSISQAFMKEKGWNHSKMTTKQRELFKELWQSGRANTMEEHSRIAVEALKAGGAPEAEARSLVGESLLNLRGQNATTPTNIPWYR